MPQGPGANPTKPTTGPGKQASPHLRLHEKHLNREKEIPANAGFGVNRIIGQIQQPQVRLFYLLAGLVVIAALGIALALIWADLD